MTNKGKAEVNFAIERKTATGLSHTSNTGSRFGRGGEEGQDLKYWVQPKTEKNKKAGPSLNSLCTRSL